MYKVLYKGLKHTEALNKIIDPKSVYTKVETKYGVLKFRLHKSRNGYEVIIELLRRRDKNSWFVLGEFGYGYYKTKSEARKEMESDIDRLINLQHDANKMYNLKGYDK